MSKKITFDAIPGISAFSFFSFRWSEPFKRCSSFIVHVLHENPAQKHLSHHPSQKFTFWIFDLVTSEDLDLTKDHKGYGRCFEVSQIRSMLFHRLGSNMMRLLCTAKPAMKDGQKYDLWPDLWRHQWPSEKGNIVRRYAPGLSNATSGSRIGLVV